MFIRTSAVVVLLFIASAAKAGDWGGFRGPDGNGISKEANAPIEWTADSNIKWKAKLPSPGNGSPIVVKGKVFVTAAQDPQDGKQRTLFCFDRVSGKQVWKRTVMFDKKMETHKTNPYCGSTPASDGEHVVVWHGSAGLYCYDLEGKKLWSRELGEFHHIWGYGTSPVIYDDRVILHTGPGKRTFVGAYNLKTGKTLWETDEEQDSTDTSYNEAKKYKGSWATPIIAKVDGRDQVICTMQTRVVGLDPQSGDIIWWCDGIRGPKGDLAYSSPLVSDGLCTSTGGFGGPSVAFKLGGRGDITETHRLWRNERNPQSIGSGVFIGKHLFKPNAGPGTIQCLDVESGDVLWTERSGTSWGSMVLAAGRLYLTTQSGATHVFKPNPEKYEEIAVNDIGEPTNSTPAISDGNIFIRTSGHLFCIGE